jgi:hypothetical protein
MRQQFGWMTVLGLTSVASPALSAENESPPPLVQPEFDGSLMLVGEQHLVADSFSDFGSIDRVGPVEEAKADFAFGTSDWDAMIHGLRDEPVAATQTNLVPDAESASLSSGLFRAQLAVAAAEEGGGEAEEPE